MIQQQFGGIFFSEGVVNVFFLQKKKRRVFQQKPLPESPARLPTKVGKSFLNFKLLWLLRAPEKFEKEKAPLESYQLILP